jgi:hypothetical protein
VPVLEAEVENVTRHARAEATARTSEELAVMLRMAQYSLCPLNMAKMAQM